MIYCREDDILEELADTTANKRFNKMSYSVPKHFIENGGKAGEFAIISADQALPYERPPLSKSFLAGKDTEDAILINDAAFYAANGIEVKLHTRVTSIDTAGKRLRTASGEEGRASSWRRASPCHRRGSAKAGCEGCRLRKCAVPAFFGRFAAHTRPSGTCRKGRRPRRRLYRDGSCCRAGRPRHGHHNGGPG